MYQLNGHCLIQVQNIATSFNIHNQGIGKAASMTVNNTNNNNPALFVTTNGNGEAGTFHITKNTNSNPAVLATTTGSGHAGEFAINNATSNASAILASTNGSGDAGIFSINNNFNLGSALVASALSGGRSLELSNSSPTNTDYVMTVAHQGIGPIAILSSPNMNNNSDALTVSTGGMGRVAWLESSNVNNGVEVLRASTAGLGKAGLFSCTNTSNASNALTVETNGTGRAGMFQIFNAANNADALTALTAGGGNAGYFETAGTNFAAEIKSTNGTPKALKTTGALQFSGIGTSTNSGYTMAGDNAGNATWRKNNAFMVRLGQNLSIAENVETLINWGVEVFDHGGGSNFDLNTDRFTATEEGLYHFDAGVNWAQAMDPDRIYLQIRQTGGHATIVTNTAQFTVAENPIITCSATMYLEVGNTVECRVFHDDPATPNHQLNSVSSTYFAGFRVY